MWKETTLLTDRAVRFATAGESAFSGSMLCQGGISTEPVQVWESKIKLFLETRYLKDMDRIDGEQMEFEWIVLYAVCSSDIRQGGHWNASPLILRLFLRIVVELTGLLQPSFTVFRQHDLRSAEQGFCFRAEIHGGTRCTVTKNELCVWRRRSFPTSYLGFRVSSKIVDVVMKVVYV